jgi:hypothetical protein
MAKLNKGGRLEARVVNFTATDFTIKCEGAGHEDAGKTITLPRTLWRGPGAEIGAEGYEPYEASDPRSAPRVNDFVYYNSDVIAAAAKKAASVTVEK